MWPGAAWTSWAHGRPWQLACAAGIVIFLVYFLLRPGKTHARRRAKRRALKLLALISTVALFLTVCHWLQLPLPFSGLALPHGAPFRQTSYALPWPVAGRAGDDGYVSVAVGITSHSGDFQVAQAQRHAIRSTWLPQFSQARGVLPYFLVPAGGLPPQDLHSLRNESAAHGDLLVFETLGPGHGTPFPGSSDHHAQHTAAAIYGGAGVVESALVLAWMRHVASSTASGGADVFLHVTDDMYVRPGVVLSELSQLMPARLLYSGYLVWRDPGDGSRASGSATGHQAATGHQGRGGSSMRGMDSPTPSSSATTNNPLSTSIPSYLGTRLPRLGMAGTGGTSGGGAGMDMMGQYTPFTTPHHHHHHHDMTSGGPPHAGARSSTAADLCPLASVPHMRPGLWALSGDIAHWLASSSIPVAPRGDVGQTIARTVAALVPVSRWRHDERLSIACGSRCDTLWPACFLGDVPRGAARAADGVPDSSSLSHPMDGFVHGLGLGLGLGLGHAAGGMDHHHEYDEGCTGHLLRVHAKCVQDEAGAAASSSSSIGGGTVEGRTPQQHGALVNPRKQARTPPGVILPSAPGPHPPSLSSHGHPLSPFPSPSARALFAAFTGQSVSHKQLLVADTAPGGACSFFAALHDPRVRCFHLSQDDAPPVAATGLPPSKGTTTLVQNARAPATLLPGAGRSANVGPLPIASGAKAKAGERAGERAGVWGEGKAGEGTHTYGSLLRYLVARAAGDVVAVFDPGRVHYRSDYLATLVRHLQGPGADLVKLSSWFEFQPEPPKPSPPPPLVPSPSSSLSPLGHVPASLSSSSYRATSGNLHLPRVHHPLAPSSAPPFDVSRLGAGGFPDRRPGHVAAPPVPHPPLAPQGPQQEGVLPQLTVLEPPPVALSLGWRGYDRGGPLTGHHHAGVVGGGEEWYAGGRSSGPGGSAHDMGVPREGDRLGKGTWGQGGGQGMSGQHAGTGDRIGSGGDGRGEGMDSGKSAQSMGMGTGASSGPHPAGRHVIDGEGNPLLRPLASATAKQGVGVGVGVGVAPTINQSSLGAARVTPLLPKGVLLYRSYALGGDETLVQRCLAGVLAELEGKPGWLRREGARAGAAHVNPPRRSVGAAVSAAAVAASGGGGVAGAQVGEQATAAVAGMAAAGEYPHGSSAGLGGGNPGSPSGPPSSTPGAQPSGVSGPGQGGAGGLSGSAGASMGVSHGAFSLVMKRGLPELGNMSDSFAVCGNLECVATRVVAGASTVGCRSRELQDDLGLVLVVGLGDSPVARTRGMTGHHGQVTGLGPVTGDSVPVAGASVLGGEAFDGLLQAGARVQAGAHMHGVEGKLSVLGGDDTGAVYVLPGHFLQSLFGPYLEQSLLVE
eukprot:jgi/Mesvir1/4892/Mv11159-RA.1